MKPIKIMTKTAILAAMTALLLPYGALASASEAPHCSVLVKLHFVDNENLGQH
ncbi:MULTISPECIES: hypothetical protein [unclassified Paenibacillus]|uniref:hypothetical protein n=1 Tax=unclassified Paenibacillus TaxID=185978 RepID=UPI003836A4BD